MKCSKKWLMCMVSILALAMLLVVADCGGAAKKDTNKAIQYPTKPINMVMAFTAGGSSDVQARIMQKYWDKLIPQPWVFQYKTGAGGAIGFAEIAKAKPDGYTIGGVNVPHIVLQPIGQKAQFSIDDYIYICQVVNDPQALVVNKDSRFKSAKEVVEYAKANPGKLKVGIVGTYSGSHMALLEWEDQAGIKTAQIVYKGAADQNAALLGGELDVMMGNVNDVMRSLDMMTVLAVTSKERVKFIPEAPTFKELGMNVFSDIRRGFVVPKGTDPQIVKILRDTFKKISEDPEYLKDMEKAGQPTEYLSGEDFEKYVKETNANAQTLLKKVGLVK